MKTCKDCATPCTYKQKEIVKIVYCPKWTNKTSKKPENKPIFKNKIKN